MAISSRVNDYGLETHFDGSEKSAQVRGAVVGSPEITNKPGGDKG